jgi:hypothetical protein
MNVFKRVLVKLKVSAPVAAWGEWQRRRQYKRCLPGMYARAIQELATAGREVNALTRELAELRGGEERALPGLSLAELERVAILAEECGEVIQVCGKILRYGWESCSPFDERCRPNRVLLERELGDVRAIIDLMLQSGDVRRVDVAAWRDQKRTALRRWTHYQGF